MTLLLMAGSGVARFKTQYIFLFLFIPLMLCAAEEPEQLYNSGASLFRHGEYELAAEDFEKAFQLATDADMRAKCMLKQAECYFKLEQYQKATTAFRDYLVHFPEHSERPVGQFRIAECFFFTGDYAKAHQAYNRFVRENPTHQYVPLALYAAAGAAIELGDFESAMADYKRLVRDFANSEQAMNARFNIAWIHLRAERFEEARRAFLDLVERYPKSKLAPEALLRAADAEYKAGRPGEAIVLYNRVLAEGRRNFTLEAKRGIAWCYLKLGEHSKAAAGFLEVAELSKEEAAKAEASHQALYSLHASLQYETGLGVANTLIASYEDRPLSPILSDSYYWKGMMLKGMGRHEEALKAFENAATGKGKEISVSELRLQTGSVLGELGRHQEAAVYLRQATEAGDEKLRNQAKFDLAKSLNDGGQTDRALTVMMQLLDELPKGSELRVPAEFSVGEFLFSREDYASALKWFRSVMEKKPDEEMMNNAVYRAGWCYKKLGDGAKAIEAFEKMNLPPNSRHMREVKFLLAQLYSDRGDTVKAAQMYNELMKTRGPFSTDAALSLAESLFRQERYEAVVEVTQNFLRDYPGHEQEPDAQYLLAEAAYASGRQDVAMAAYSSVVGSGSPLRENALYGKAWLHFDRKEYQAAIRSLETLLNDYPQTSYASSTIQLMGRIYGLLGQPEKAKEVYRTAYQKGEQSDEMLLNMAIAEGNMGNFAEAVALIDRFFKDYPSSPLRGKALYEKGRALKKMQKDDQALEVFRFYRQTVNGGEYDSDVAFALGDIYTDKKQYDQAKQYYRESANDSRYADKALYRIAWAEQEQKKFDEAAATFQRLAREMPDSEYRMEALYRTALCFMSAGELEKANRAFADYLQIGVGDKFYDKALYNSAKVMEKLGMQAKAKQRYESYVQNFPEGNWRGHCELALGEMEMNQGNYAKARDHFLTLASDSTHPKAMEAHLGIGNAYLKEALEKGSGSQKEELLKEAIKSFIKVEHYGGNDESRPFIAQAFLKIAECKEALGDYDSARQWYKKVYTRFPKLEYANTAAEREQRIR